MQRYRLGWAAGLAMSLALLGAQTSYADKDHGSDKDDKDDPRVVFTIDSPLITESSSLAVSSEHPGLVYTANDSGDAAIVYVLSDGRLVGRLGLADVDAVDIEAMSAGADGALVVADIGDNAEARDHVTIYRVAQPGPGNLTQEPDQVTLTYADGPRDAESVLYDARTGRVYVVSKQLLGASIYQTPTDVFGRFSAVLRPVADAPITATDATLVPGTDLAVIRTYGNAYLYRYPQWKQVGRFDLPRLEQGESIAAPPGGKVVWAGSEGERAPVVAVHLPAVKQSDEGTDGPPATPSSTPSPPAQPSEPAAEQQTSEPIDGDSDGAGWAVPVAAAGAAVLAVGGILVAVRRRRR